MKTINSTISFSCVYFSLMEIHQISWSYKKGFYKMNKEFKSFYGDRVIIHNIVYTLTLIRLGDGCNDCCLLCFCNGCVACQLHQEAQEIGIIQRKTCSGSCNQCCVCYK
ncbi:unnamed protein product [Trichobilharzia szidati]|nr:unnamed protein product [Trichobilharzia szidati]